MNAVAKTIEEVSVEARQFQDEFKTLNLATASDDAIPTATYAPFAPVGDGQFGIYVSELTAHTPNLMAGRPVSALLIESEQDSQHLFARRRLTYTCNVEHMPRDSDGFETILGALQDRFGDFMEFMRTMQDFHAFLLTPIHAAYVRGFAQAYEFPDADFNQCRHVNDKGHREAS